MEFEETFSQSPAALFRRLLDRTAETIGHATYVEEWLGPRRRLPEFAVNVIGDFAAESENRQPLCYCVLCPDCQRQHLGAQRRALAVPPLQGAEGTRAGAVLDHGVRRAAYSRVGEAVLSANFRVARRFLNVLTRQHLYPIRQRWFQAPPGSSAEAHLHR